jgi:predicted nucleotidyltransferase component of viral defense system
MTVNIESLHARLLNLSRERKMDFQILLNRIGAEQFLFRLSRSPYAEKFIFKGGSLLSYLIETDRKTKDLDFSVKGINNEVENIVKIFRSILEMPADDGFEWKDIEGKRLDHPEVDYPGVRITCRFLLGNMKGVVRMDVASGDVVSAVKHSLKRMRYRNEPIFGEDFSVLIYPLETVFAEKMHIVVKKGGQNTRMKDYYDLFKLMDHELDAGSLEKSIKSTFANRDMALAAQVDLGADAMARLQLYWSHYIKKESLANAPEKISDIILRLNAFLEKIFRTD